MTTVSKQKAREQRSAILKQRRLVAIEHISARIKTLERLGKAPTGNLKEMTVLSRSHTFLSDVRAATIRNLDRSQGVLPADRIEKGTVSPPSERRDPNADIQSDMSFLS